MLLLLLLLLPVCWADNSSYRLPGNIRPINYTLNIAVFTVNLTTKGEVGIFAEISAATNKITLHVNSSRVNISQGEVMVRERQLGGWVDVGVSSQLENGEKEFHTLVVDKDLVPGSRVLVILPFSGIIKDGRPDQAKVQYPNTTGLYISEDADGGLMAITQFETTFARDAFPCFDEPHLKANFTLSIGRHRDQVSRSNMPHTSVGVARNASQEYVWDQYKQSVAMSTYLVAFMVSNYGYTEDFTKRGVPYRSWYTKKKLNQTQHATQAGVKIMDYLQENIFKPSYPIEKMDQVAVTDYWSGAMENWGMMTFRSTVLLDSSDNMRGTFGIDYIISHELVHQWCGNLVTMSWWNDTWLNEGITSYWEWHGLLALYPEDLVWQSMSSDRYKAFSVDDQVNTVYPHHVITAMEEKWVQSQSEIMDIIDQFGTFRYERGSSILAMIVDMIGLDTVLAGMNAYLIDKAFSTAITDDLWTHLDSKTRASGFFVDKPKLTFRDMMNPWITVFVSPTQSYIRICICKTTII